MVMMGSFFFVLASREKNMKCLKFSGCHRIVGSFAFYLNFTVQNIKGHEIHKSLTMPMVHVSGIFLDNTMEHLCLSVDA